MPISITVHSSAECENAPLVVSQKLLRKVSRKYSGVLPERDMVMSMRQSRNGRPSPRWPQMIFSFG